MAQPIGIPKERNIVRVDIPDKENRIGTHGWQVRFTHEGREISKLFSDTKYDGIESALEEARNFRDSFSIDFDAIKRNRKPANYPSSVKKVEGVFFIKGRPLKTKPGEYSSYWRAQWPKGPTMGKGGKNFFIATYGFDKAYELAVQARREAMGETKEFIEKRSIFSTPNDPNINIWRYLDFTKFISLLETKSLFFVSVNHLNDPFEGSLSALNKALRPSLFEKKFFEKQINRAEMRTRVAVNCWHINTYESAAMWKLYTKTNEAVCIQSTYKLLREALPSLFRISKVRYVDFNSDWVPESHPLAPFVFKRKSFEHEQELRALIDIEEADERLYNFLGLETAEFGLYKRISVQKLIENIFVAPESPDWFLTLVERACRTYNLKDVPVIRSSLETEPFF